ncbi:MAG: NAD-dependent epimerase/dehydratase family protein [Rhodospirillales bacterium]|nr:MAG: NAD-dependent epimerase/dehydratase family protein [Rhodospirillales bacterium]
MTAKHYLVTGGTGFIGAALVCRLVQEGQRVRVLDNNSRGAMRRLAGVTDQIEMVEGDIRDSAVVTAAAQGVDNVLHLAYVNGTRFFYEKPELVLDVGVRGMVNVLDACRANKVPELVLASSSEVYQTPPSVPTAEDVPLSVPDPRNPRYSYGGGKIICELMALNYGRSGFERVMIFRPHNVYGPDMGWEHVIPEFSLRMKALAEQPGKLRFPIQGTGEETRAFVHIDDFTDGILAMLKGGEHLNIYHVGTREEVTMGDLAHRVAACFGREIVLEPSKPPAGATNRRCPDIGKLQKLGYNPARTLAAALPGVVQWYADNAKLKPGNE